MEKLRSLVPSPSVASAVTPKPPTRLVSANRKVPHPKPNGRPEKPATPPPSALQLRKATSEPALLNQSGSPTEDLVRKMRAMKREKSKVALKETLEETEVAAAKRNNFLMDVFKREKQIQEAVGEEDSALTSLSEEGLSVDNPNARFKSLSTLPEDVLLAREKSQSPALPDEEDEERFLRLLGWRPEEEDHVPELEEAEIAEVRLKINQQQGSPSSPPHGRYNGMGLALGLGREMTVSIHQD